MRIATASWMYTGNNLMNRSRQRGMALLLLMLTLTVGAAGLLLSGREPVAQAGAQDSVQAEIDLRRAVDALVGYHIGHPGNPGALVCPDHYTETNSDGIEVYGVADELACGSGDPWFIGRLPWRTLDLPREYGRLWYIIDADFRNDNPGSGGSGGSGEGGGTTSSSEPLNSGVSGELLLNGESGYSAIVFDPGAVRDGQDRQPGNYYDEDHYLDGDNADQDSSDSTPEFVDCSNLPNCNDRARGIRDDELFAIVQLRVIGELKQELESYYADHGNTLPRAAPSGSTTCDADTFRGEIPQSAGSSCDSHEFIDTDDLPDWLVDNDWLDYIVYVVDEGCTATGSGCGNLSVNGDNSVHVVLFGAGADGLDHDENTDLDDEFVRVPVTHANNDVARWRYDVGRWR